jgi:hypothetical protein
MSNIRVIKKGELVFKEGDKIQNLLMIQQGTISVFLARPKKNIELFSLGTSAILGEQALSGASVYPFSATATQEAKLLELPVDLVKQQVEAAPQTLKVLIKSLNDRLKSSLSEVRSSKMEKDGSPCPEDQTAKIFGSLFHAAKCKGQKVDEKNKDKITVDWNSMKQYAQRIFGESPKRLEQACSIMVKLKLAQFEMGRPPEDPEGPEMIMKVHFFNLDAAEWFFEFYQYHYFKGSNPEVLKPDDASLSLVNHFIKLSESLTPDRFGVVSMDLGKAIESFKTELGINLNSDHFARLEQKGLFAKRAPQKDGGVFLQYELKEFQRTQVIWKVLKEIEKWNEKGFVDLTEDESKLKKKDSGPACPHCGASVVANAKFCIECGNKITSAA